jgi:hypothetical protein
MKRRYIGWARRPRNWSITPNPAPRKFWDRRSAMWGLHFHIPSAVSFCCFGFENYRPLSIIRSTETYYKNYELILPSFQWSSQTYFPFELCFLSRIRSELILPTYYFQLTRISAYLLQFERNVTMRELQIMYT